MAYTSLKDHLLNMNLNSHAYERMKAEEALQGSNKTVQALHRTNCTRIAQAHIRLMDWQPTIQNNPTNGIDN
jgi:hypothetical protein